MRPVNYQYKIRNYYWNYSGNDSYYISIQPIGIYSTPNSIPSLSVSLSFSDFIKEVEPLGALDDYKTVKDILRKRKLNEYIKLFNLKDPNKIASLKLKLELEHPNYGEIFDKYFSKFFKFNS